MKDFREPPFKLPRLLLLNAEPQMASSISLALGSHCLPFAFGEPYRSAIRALLNESIGTMEPEPEFVEVGEHTYLRRNLETMLQDSFVEQLGEDFTGLLLAHRMWHELPYFACLSVEDATVPNTPAVRHLCNRFISSNALAAKEIYWLHIDGTTVVAPPWVTAKGIRFGSMPASQLTSKAEILSAMEMLA